jgi:hypothetical protein
MLESLIQNKKNFTFQQDQNRIQNKLVSGILNAKTKIKATPSNNFQAKVSQNYRFIDKQENEIY